MNIVPWRDSNDDVSVATTRGGGEVEEDQEQETNGKTVITKKQSLISPSSSSSWMKSKDPRIVRVSRAFGGKDRHSKVCTLRGLRDRRVRLSVPTAIQLYDLQERLGLDQPSKAVDWLLEVAKEEIDELPPLPVSPENFSIFNNHQSFLNLGQRPSQDPSQIRFKSCLEDHQTTTTASREANNNKEKGETEAVFANNHHIGSYIGTYHHQNIEHHLQLHHQHSSFQADYHHPHQHQHQHQQLHSLVPFPSQILVCPMTTTTSTTTTIQSLFPSSSTSAGSGAMETIDPRQIANHFQMPLMGNNSSSSSSQNMSSLYSLLHGTSTSNSNINNPMSPVQFNRANSGGNVSRLLGSEHCTSRGSDHRM